MPKVPQWLMIGLIVLVASAWATSFGYAMISTSYEPPESINVLFASIVTGLVLGAGKKKDDNDKDDKGNTPGGAS